MVATSAERKKAHDPPPAAEAAGMLRSMTDWITPATSAATAIGTLVLAVATFSSIRAGNRSARTSEAALLASIRPTLVPSMDEDPTIRVSFVDGHVLNVPGGCGAVEVTESAIYLALSLRNVGNGLAVLDRWDLQPGFTTNNDATVDVQGLSRLTRDIYVPSGGVGFWQGALRESSDPLFKATAEAVASQDPLVIRLLNADHDGGQSTVSRFTLVPDGERGWTALVSRHWNLDRAEPR